MPRGIVFPMKVFSENIHLFTHKCEQFLKDIINQETTLKLRRSRFEFNSYTYPLHIVIFQNQTKLGYFDPHTYQIGLNQDLMYSTKESVLKDILRHEFAHYLCFLMYPNATEAHGNEFKSICESFGWDRSISKASLNIELANNEKIGQLASEKLINKIKNLLKLADSDNVHEAELATLKANQLLLKHNLQYYDLESSDKRTYTKTLITSKRKNAKLSCIYDIIKHFMVRPVLIYGQGQVALEATGSLESIELADYVTAFLDRELEVMWKKNKSPRLKGLKAKNSFFHGVAKGYHQKAQSIKDDLKVEEKNALVIIEKDLDEMMNKIYRRISHTSSRSSFDSNAYDSGVSAGKNLNINKSVKSKNNTTSLLSWRER